MHFVLFVLHSCTLTIQVNILNDTLEEEIHHQMRFFEENKLNGSWLLLIATQETRIPI